MRAEINQFQHTAARRRLPAGAACAGRMMWFQHTAARRRLHRAAVTTLISEQFQHTAARRRLPQKATDAALSALSSFNTQPPEGGCRLRGPALITIPPFQHTAARRRLREA